MKTKKEPCLLVRAIIYLLKGVFLRAIGSWGAFVVDKNGNLIDVASEGK